MTVLIDADGCPVVDITVHICKGKQIPCLILCDTSHQIERDGAITLTFEKQADSVDYAIANRVHAGDLVITQDYGLASMCLARNARVLHQDGWEYTPSNIEALLFQRHESRKLRQRGVHLKHQPKRTTLQNQQFIRALEDMLK